MANFDHSIEIVLHHEGGYVNNKKDPGGETNFGISKRSYPDINIKALTRESAKAIYFRDFWIPSNLGQFDSQELATKVFSQGVLLGMKTAIKRLQFSVRAVNKQELVADGIIGKATLEAVNSISRNAIDLFALRCAFRAELGAFYRYKRRNPTFIKGWLNRAYYIIKSKLKRS